MKHLAPSRNICGALLAMLLSSGASATCEPGDPGKIIGESFNQQWAEAVRRGDRATVESLYSEEALLMPPTDETLYGPASIGVYLLEHFGRHDLRDYGVDLVSCEVRGDTLHLAGVWGARAEYGDHGPRYVGGNVVRVLTRRADGTWISQYDIWN